MEERKPEQTSQVTPAPEPDEQAAPAENAWTRRFRRKAANCDCGAEGEACVCAPWLWA